MTVKIIAEAGVNHNGRLDTAIALVDAAKLAGADVVKFQIFSAKDLASSVAPMAAYQVHNLGRRESQQSMLKKLELTSAEHQQIKEYCDSQSIGYLASPFDHESLTFLSDELHANCVKVASGEITNGPMLLEIGRRQLDVILSTGMSTPENIDNALAVLAFGMAFPTETPRGLQACRRLLGQDKYQSLVRDKVSLLHCTSQYPAPIDSVNLRAMVTMANRWELVTGYSDHTLGITVPIAAVALGARILEKHLTLDRSMEGPDHRCSLEPDEFTILVNSVREAEAALGSAEKAPSAVEEDTRNAARKSIQARDPIVAGDVIQADQLVIRRPGNGVSPMLYWDLLGREALRNYDTGEPLRE